MQRLHVGKKDLKSGDIQRRIPGSHGLTLPPGARNCDSRNLSSIRRAENSRHGLRGHSDAHPIVRAVFPAELGAVFTGGNAVNGSPAPGLLLLELEKTAAVHPRCFAEREEKIIPLIAADGDSAAFPVSLRSTAADRADPDCEVRLTAGPEPRLVEESMDVTQGKLALGFRTGGQTCWEPDYPAFTVMNAIFGGTTLSKLFLNVREKLSLCYYASSAMEKMKGLILVSSGIEFDKFQTARDEIRAQLEAIRRGEIEDWELEGAKHTLMGGHLATLDDQGRQEEFWLGQAAAGLETTIEELCAQFEGGTKQQVARSAQRLELDTVYFLKGKEA